MTDYKRWTKTCDALVKMKHRAGKSVLQIARDMGVNEMQVRKALKRLGLKPHKIKAEERSKINTETKRKPSPRKGVPMQLAFKKRQDDPPAERGSFDAGNPIRAAEMALSSRLTYRGGQWILDGSPCDLNRLMREANRARRKLHLPMLGKNPAWWVE